MFSSFSSSAISGAGAKRGTDDTGLRIVTDGSVAETEADDSGPEIGRRGFIEADITVEAGSPDPTV